MSSPADALRDRLAALGVDADVAADGALAIVDVPAPRPAASWPDAERRRAIVAEARACGFTHVALELRPPPDDAETNEESGADVRRDQPGR